MRKRLTQIFESIVYAGLRPDQRRDETSAKSRFKFIDRFLDGGKSPDPFYLSNQTAWQKIRRALLIATPFLLIGVVIALSSLRLINKTTVRQAEPTAAEIAARSLNFSDLKLDHKREVEVLEASLADKGQGQVVLGRAQNLTDRNLAEVGIVFELTNSQGSQVGTHRVVLRDLGPRAAVAFESPIAPSSAVAAIVTAVQAN